MDQQNPVRTRSQMDPEYTWKLEDIYASDDDFEKDFTALKARVGDFAVYAGQLGQSARTLLDALALKFQCHLAMERLYVYASMRQDEDNANAHYQALVDRAGSLSTELSSAMSFIVPQMLAIEPQRLEAFMDSDRESFAPYRFFIEQLIRQRSHVLGQSEEKLLAMAGEVLGTAHTVFSMLNDADMKFPPIRDENGNETELTHGRYILFLESKDRGVRKSAFDAVYGTYEKQLNTLAALYSSSVKRDVFVARARNYKSALHASLDDDNIPPSVYHNLIEAVHDSLPALGRYIDIRKTALGLPDLQMWDLYAPIVEDVEISMTYDQAKDMLLEGLAPLGDEYLDRLREGFSQRWIDVYENRNKTSGAYSWGVYGTHPYVLMNFQNNLDNAFTLAHEMGHALHSYYSNKAQPYTDAAYPLFLAEVASTVNEVLMMEHALETMPDKRQKLYLMNYFIEQFRTTLIRQVMFAEFELFSHQAAEDGTALTREALSEAYYALNQKYYGPSMHVDSKIAWEWARIPHFYRAFYVYKYATGFSSAVAIAQAIRAQGEPARARYMDFLSGGGSDYPLDTLKKAGVDLTGPEPVRAALGAFGQLVDRFGALLED